MNSYVNNDRCLPISSKADAQPQTNPSDNSTISDIIVSRYHRKTMHNHQRSHRRTAVLTIAATGSVWSQRTHFRYDTVSLTYRPKAAAIAKFKFDWCAGVDRQIPISPAGAVEVKKRRDSGETDCTMSVRENTKFVVVSFTTKNMTNNLAEVELIPTSWLVSSNNGWSCYYPPKRDYKNVAKWVELSRDPVKSWKLCKINIVAEAADYAQGLRRMHRSFVEIPVSSVDEMTDAEKELVAHAKVLATDAITTLNNIDEFPLFEPNGDSDSDDVMAGVESLDRKRRMQNSRSENKTKKLRIIGDDTGSALIQLPRSYREPNNFLPAAETTAGLSQSEMFRVVDDDFMDFEETNGNDDLLLSTETAAEPRQAPSINNTDAMLERILKHQEESEKRVMKKIENMKRSILYEVRLKAEEIKTTITSATGSALGTTYDKHRAALGIEFPISTNQTFLRLEELLSDARKIESIKVVMTTKTYGHSECSKAIGSILSSIISKPVQLLYSGCGRETKVNGNIVSKFNFSRTLTYKCMEQVIVEKFQKSEQDVLTMTSKWLAGAGDRERGRAARR